MANLENKENKIELKIEVTEEEIEKYFLRLESELNDEQIKFCVNYLEDFNTIESYRKAYQKDNVRMSDEVAYRGGRRLLGKQKVKDFMRILLYHGMEELEFKLLTPAKTYRSVERMAINADYRYPPSVELEANKLIGQAQGIFNGDTFESIETTRSKLAGKVVESMKQAEQDKKSQDSKESKGE